MKKAAFLGQEYFVKPLPNFGDPGASLLILGHVLYGVALAGTFAALKRRRE